MVYYADSYIYLSLIVSLLLLFSFSMYLFYVIFGKKDTSYRGEAYLGSLAE